MLNLLSRQLNLALLAQDEGSRALLLNLFWTPIIKELFDLESLAETKKEERKRLKSLGDHEIGLA